jgi:DNA-directed RNA polymerase subunit E'/Rpb7
MKEIISEQINVYDILITPNYLNKNLNVHILRLLKEKYENKCSDMGYILKDSFEFIEKSEGIIQYHDNKSYLLYKITCKFKVINPVIGDNIDCIINNITKAGIILYTNILKYKNEKIEVNSIEESPIICIIPISRIDNINEYNIKQILNVNISAVRKKYNASNIQVVGSIN